MAIAASLLVAIPVVFMVRGLAPDCQYRRVSPGLWVRRQCSVDVSRVLGTIKISLLDIGVALLGIGVGWIVAARQHRQRRWPAAAAGALIIMSVLYAIYFFLALNSLGRWSF